MLSIIYSFLKIPKMVMYISNSSSYTDPDHSGPETVKMIIFRQLVFYFVKYFTNFCCNSMSICRSKSWTRLWIRILQIFTSNVEPKPIINTCTFSGVYNHLVNKLCNKLHLFHTKPGGFVKILRTLKSAKFFFTALYCRKLRRNFRYLSAVPRWQIS